MNRRDAALRRHAATAVLAGALVAGLAGCASTPSPGGGAAMGTNPVDPWEAYNRKVYAFNDAIDRAVLKPVAEAYRDHVPPLVRRGIDNVLGNIGDVWSAVNQLLQGKLEYGLNMGMRVLTNTFFGLGGLLDPATEMGLVRRSEDFGQTLGRWGVQPGPFVMLPFFGPRTVRDTVGFVADMPFEPSRVPQTTTGTYTVFALALVNSRANLLSASSLLDQAALDRYSLLRDAYLARRLDAVHDGNPPLETYDDDKDPAPATPSPGTPASAPTRP